MKKRLFLTACLWFIISAPAQNLIANPGFENGLTGWAAFWSRDGSSAGSAALVSSPVHAGAAAVHLLHTGTNDWSYSPSADYAVQPGQVYSYSAWVLADSIREDAQISLVLYDSSRTALDWSFAAKVFDPADHGWRLYATTFVAGLGVRFIRPRIIGNGPCGLYADDLDLRFTDSITGYDSVFTLENSQIRCDVRPGPMVFAITDKAAAKSYTTEPLPEFRLHSASQAGPIVSLACLYMPDSIETRIDMSLSGQAVRFVLSGDSTRPLSDDIVFPGCVPGEAGKHLIIPKSTGAIVANDRPLPGEWTFNSFDMWGHQSTSSYVGLIDLTSGYMLVSDDPWDTRVYMDLPWNTSIYRPQLRHAASKGMLGYSRTFYFTVIPSGGYTAMAQWYRAHADGLGWTRTFSEKASDAPDINKLMGAADLWFIQPDLWWLRSAKCLDTLLDYGIDRAVLTIDGPQGIIDSANARGYLTSVYDVYCDGYPPLAGHPGWPTAGYPEDIIIESNGDSMKGWLAFIDDTLPYQAYEVCSKAHWDHARTKIDQERLTEHLNCRFIDVELSTSLLECYSPAHPVTRREDAAERAVLFRNLRERYGLVLGGEQARDFAFPWLDYGEGTMSLHSPGGSGYDWSTPVDTTDTLFTRISMNPALRIPLHGLSFHDVHIPTWYTGDGASKVPAYWDHKDLFNILYASMPLFIPPDSGYWRANLQKYLTSYHCVTIAQRGAGFSKMTDHRFLTGDRMVQETRFENGWAAGVNFGNSQHVYDGKTLPRTGFYAYGNGMETYRAIENGQTLAVARTPDRLFVNPYGVQNHACGVQTAGPLFLERRDSALIHLALLGTQAYADIDTNAIPFPISGMRVFTVDRSQEIIPVSQAGGYVRINKSDNCIFYRLEGRVAYTGLAAPISANALPKLQVLGMSSPVTILFRTDSPGRVTLSLFDIRGACVMDLAQGKKEAGIHSAVLPANLAAGVYVCRLTEGGKQWMKKLVVIR